MKKTILFTNVYSAAELTDPTKKMKKFHLLVPTKYLPKNISKGANPRKTNLNSKISKEVKESLLSDDGLFHTKNKGLTIIGSNLINTSPGNWELTYNEELHGCLDGGHTYSIITENQCVENQYVPVEILINVEDYMVSTIASARNTTMNVTKSSIYNYEGHYDWIKKTLGPTKSKFVKFDQNDTKTFYRVEKLLSIMYGFMPDIANINPKNAYLNETNVLKFFNKNPKQFERFSHVLIDLMKLYETVTFDLGNSILTRKRSDKKGKSGYILLFKEKTVKFPFIQKETKYETKNGIVIPILSSLRYLLNKNYTWKWGSIDSTIDVWNEMFPEILTIVTTHSKDQHFNTDAIGKASSFWNALATRINTSKYVTG